jgi:hypothetical protein
MTQELSVAVTCLCCRRVACALPQALYETLIPVTGDEDQARPAVRASTLGAHFFAD